MDSTGTRSERLDLEARLANRAALLTIVSLCAFLVSMLAIKLTFDPTRSAAARVAASTPAVVGAAVALRARSVRGQLRAVREESVSVSSRGGDAAGSAS
jgi:hypothetical protein